MREQLVKSSAQIYDGTDQCTSITIHETANESVGADAQAHANLRSNGNVHQVSWHITVDDTEAIRSYPDTAQWWHAGTREGAESSIAVEICVNSDGNYDKAFALAAEVVAGLRAKHGIPRSKVYDHAHWTGRNCPSVMRATGRWQEFLNLTEGANPTIGTMVSPFEGRLTANHQDRGGYKGHKGLDIAPPKPGQTRMPVYAAFAGTWKKIVRNVKAGNRASTLAPARTGGGGLIANPDGEGNGYNHVDILDAWKVGDKAAVGDLIGYNDLSGNQTGAHVHFEMWKDWEDHNSDYDPRDAFDAHGVRPGSAPKGIITPVASKPKPKPKPSTSKPKPASSVNSRADNTAIQTALT
ncbi:N-acetylmuramoyl-L-alanine amidase [Paeniglutamicibacter terrestris]|uniref:N-acetylmuramoyl-L-alanine amidase n=1 Tax=Paeniglutamicibacter terrestris TaxID=2723403 RepID=A0ABX1G8P1_9MICC|nr:N-acetylmuramoyl-L-alanine amidase [Paeniglutamicibacter terrestris]NKG22389.1 peptidoglycan DD-metalloendopeptidase family protein [Paeniglutamicibacter terrestris]